MMARTKLNEIDRRIEALVTKWHGSLEADELNEIARHFRFKQYGNTLVALRHYLTPYDADIQQEWSEIAKLVVEREES